MPTVLILGAASDMAVAIAKEYAAHGYTILLAARNCERLSPLVSDISIRMQAQVSAHEFDAADFEQHVNFYNTLPASPDVTVCVFGYLGKQETAEESWAECERIIHTNFTGAVSILNVVASDYKHKKTGCIIGISSVAGERGRQSNFIYGSAKAGFTAYLSGLRNRLFPYGIHVATIQPGFVYTKMTENLKLPPLLTAHPEQVARAVYKAGERKKNVVYTKWYWKWIMLIIKAIPEPVFKKMKL